MLLACAKMVHLAQGKSRVPRPAPLEKIAWQQSMSVRFTSSLPASWGVPGFYAITLPKQISRARELGAEQRRARSHGVHQAPCADR